MTRTFRRDGWRRGPGGGKPDFLGDSREKVEKQELDKQRRINHLASIGKRRKHGDVLWRSANLLGTVALRPAALALTSASQVEIRRVFKDNGGVQNSAALYLSFPSCQADCLREQQNNAGPPDRGHRFSVFSYGLESVWLPTGAPEEDQHTERLRHDENVNCIKV